MVEIYQLKEEELLEHLKYLLKLAKLEGMLEVVVLNKQITILPYKGYND